MTVIILLWGRYDIRDSVCLSLLSRVAKFSAFFKVFFLFFIKMKEN